MYRFRQTEEETSQHLCQCGRLARLRLECIAEPYPGTANYVKTTLLKPKKLLKNKNIDRVIYIIKIHNKHKGHSRQSLQGHLMNYLSIYPQYSGPKKHLVYRFWYYVTGNIRATRLSMILGSPDSLGIDYFSNSICIIDEVIMLMAVHKRMGLNA